LPAANTRRLLRWVCTNNPFYVLSAGLFLVGLWTSVATQADDVSTWALMFGLIGYTLLLAVTACLLVRLGGVWDDVRTVLLLVVLMFLATSVTFDGVLVDNPERGAVFYLVGLFFAGAVSEGVLRSTRLLLPGWFRASYYLLLGLFFLYPLALAPLLDQPHSEELRWALFGFSGVAGLVSLTLLPAIRRGSDYVRDNGSPWRWPLYPWVLFGVLGFAVPARAFLLCWSMHKLTGSDMQSLIFGLYFLVPFGLAVAVLLLELALVTHRPGVLAAALTAPLFLVALTAADHRMEPVYRDFLRIFTDRLGGDPLSLTILASAAFYAYAAIRGVRGAADAVAATLAALAFVGPDTLHTWEATGPRPLPILAAAAIELALGLRQRSAWRCLIGGAGLVAFLALTLPEDGALRGALAFHLVLLIVLILGAAFNDAVGQLLRCVAGLMIFLACLVVMVGDFNPPGELPSWLLEGYPLLLAAILLGYGRVLRHRPSLAFAGLSLGVWLVGAGIRGYASMRNLIPGLDLIALGLVLFGLGVLISLGKAGVFSRWLAKWTGEEFPPSEEGPILAMAIQREAPASEPLVSLGAAPVGQEIQPAARDDPEGRASHP
jgi:hypothetical protein